MTAPDGENRDDPLLDALAAYDDRLAAGDDEPPGDAGQRLVPEWNQLAAFLRLVEHAWPRDGAQLTSTIDAPAAGTEDQPPAGTVRRAEVVKDSPWPPENT